MKYRDILGFSKPKKKVVKEQPKPKKTVVDKLKKDLLKESITWRNRKFGDRLPTMEDYKEEHDKNNLKEVGAAADYKKYIKLIDKDFDSLVNNVGELKNLLMRSGAKKQAGELQQIFAKNVGKFRSFMKIKFLRMINKLI